MTVELPSKLRFLLTSQARYKVAYGGRGSAKSWTFARALIVKALREPIRWLCAREYQVSLQESVHRLLSDQIVAMGVADRFKILQSSIKGVNGSEFLFKGIATDPAGIKSMERLNGAWVEEAESVSDASWEFLIPTIREEGSEIWVSFNPALRSDPTWKRFVITPPEDAIIVKVSYRDNPWFPAVLEKERLELKSKSLSKYRNVWEGEPGVPGETFFAAETLEAIAAHQQAPDARGVLEQAGDKIRFLRRSDGWLKVWEHPDAAQDYAIGADVSEGTTGGDRHSGHVLLRGPQVRQVARLAPHVGPDDLGRHLVLAAKWYGGRGWLGIERNGLGLAAVIAARDTNYPYLYAPVDPLTGKASDKYGWQTSSTSRPVLLADLDAGLRDGDLVVRSEDTIDQLSTFVRTESGRPEAAAGCHDDEVFGLGIAYQMAVRTSANRASPPARPRGGYVGGYNPAAGSWMGV